MAYHPRAPVTSEAASEMEAVVDGQTIGSILGNAAALHPNRPALLQSGYSITFEELARVVAKLAGWLREQGVAPGHHVALLMENSVEFVAAHYALATLGSVVVPLSTHSRGRMLRDALDMSDAAHVITSPALADAVTSLAPAPLAVQSCLLLEGTGDLARLRVRLGAGASLLLADLVVAEVGERPSQDDQAVLFLTSGTTGKPKGIQVTHRQVLIGIDAWTRRWGYDEHTVSLMAAPYFHVVYNPLVLGAHRHGGAAAVVTTFQARAATREAERTGATAMMGTPFFYMQLLNDSTSNGRDLSQLRQVIYGAAPTPVPVIRALQARFPDAKLFNCYGLTETCSALSCLDSDEMAGREASVGRAHPGVKASIRGADHEELPAGAVGEVYCRGENVITSYYRAPEVSAARFHAGWLRTGDLGYLDAQGYLFLLGRSDDVINVAGEKAYPQDIENVLFEFPDVLDAAAFSVPDAAKGQRVKALVVARSPDSFDLSSFRKFCAQHLPRAFVPKDVELVNALPRNPAGKVVRGELAAEAVRASSQS